MSSPDHCLTRAPDNRYFHWLCCFTAFLFGAALPTSSFFVNVALALSLVCMLWRRDVASCIKLAKNPLIWLPTLLFVLLALSLLLSHYQYGFAMVSKYKKLLYILPLALFFLNQPALVKHFITGFLSANALILAISLPVGLFSIPLDSISSLNPTVFKLQITQNFFMALAALIWLSQSFVYQGIKRWACLILVLLASINILFMVQGRTGYVALAVATGSWLMLSISSRQRLGLLVCSLLAIGMLAVVPNKAVNHTLMGVNEIRSCLSVTDGGANGTCNSSMGLRTAFTLESLRLIKQAPLVGNGAGSFFYHNVENGDEVHNPHNEYLLTTVQTGLVGLTIFLAWMLCCYRTVWRQAIPARNLLVAAMNSYMACHLFNSFLLDFAEGILFMVIAAIIASCAIKPKNSDHSTIPSH